jgi:hypothetical protein
VPVTAFSSLTMLYVRAGGLEGGLGRGWRRGSDFVWCAFMVRFSRGFSFSPADLVLFLGWVLLDLVLLEDGSCWICCIGFGLLLYFWRFCVVLRCWMGDLKWWSGGELLVIKVVDEVLTWCVVDADPELVFLWYLDSLTVAKFVEICRTLFWVADGFQVCWDLQVS